MEKKTEMEDMAVRVAKSIIADYADPNTPEGQRFLQQQKQQEEDEEQQQEEKEKLLKEIKDRLAKEYPEIIFRKTGEDVDISKGRLFFTYPSPTKRDNIVFRILYSKNNYYPSAFEIFCADKNGEVISTEVCKSIDDLFEEIEKIVKQLKERFELQRQRKPKKQMESSADDDNVSKIAKNIVAVSDMEEENLRILKNAVMKLIHTYDKLDIDLGYMKDMPDVIYCYYESKYEDLVWFNISYDWNDGGYNVVGVDEDGEDIIGYDKFETLDEMVNKFADYIKELDTKYEEAHKNDDKDGIDVDDE